jgi:ketosteroid isomerase-like protein
LSDGDVLRVGHAGGFFAAPLEFAVRLAADALTPRIGLPLWRAGTPSRRATISPFESTDGKFLRDTRHRHHFANGISGYRQIRFVDLRFWPMQDPEYVGLQCRGRFVLNNGSPYENDYFCIYRVVGGKVAWWVEYYNLMVFSTSHGGVESACEQYAVDALE